MPTARRRRRLPDEVRTAVVRAVLCLALTLVGIVLAVLSSYADSWLMTPALMAMGLGVFGTMWCLLEILISRQVAAQRVRAPNSASPMGDSRTPAGPPQPQTRSQPQPQPRPRVPQPPPQARPPYAQPPYTQPPQAQPPYPQPPYAQPSQRPGTPPPYPGGPGPRQAGATTR
ncbi:hypothetical protein [Kitasatospora purpeofusca]|uniref:hypothetical protein n=1 Tax=Kitasatospora purpeofusca TaxID=67352 RepID=UPI002253FF8F|nr:hypothetical protein [Kitasatospora purpeofusca]MCX4756431.1 hypothetical protein [Kitasatospora purpeofusca]WSR35750.1 hypothetical protein OG715_35225 [Kitasatospora purpeofusca]